MALLPVFGVSFRSFSRRRLPCVFSDQKFVHVGSLLVCNWVMKPSEFEFEHQIPAAMWLNQRITELGSVHQGMRFWRETQQSTLSTARTTWFCMGFVRKNNVGEGQRKDLISVLWRFAFSPQSRKTTQGQRIAKHVFEQIVGRNSSS